MVIGGMAVNEDNSGNTKPDVERIISEIRRNIDNAEEMISPEMNEAVDVESDIYGNLGEANRTCETGRFRSSGAASRLRGRFMAPLIDEINQFHGHVIRVLNRLIRLLDGTDTELESPVLDNARKRMDTVSALSRRLAEYDEANIEQRLTDIEQRLSRIENPEQK